MKFFRSKLGAVIGLIAVSLVPFAADAACCPYSTLTGAVNFTAVSTAVLAVAALVVAVLVTIRAVRWIYSIVKH